MGHLSTRSVCVLGGQGCPVGLPRMRGIQRGVKPSEPMTQGLRGPTHLCAWFRPPETSCFLSRSKGNGSVTNDEFIPGSRADPGSRRPNPRERITRRLICVTAFNLLESVPPPFSLLCPLGNLVRQAGKTWLHPSLMRVILSPPITWIVK